MKKIGILTYFWADNPGTFLQAYSTLQAFKKKFPDDRVELVDFKHRKVSFKLKKAHVNIKNFINDLNRYLKYRAVKKKHFVTSPEKIITQDYKLTIGFLKKQNYDLIVVGADTILNPIDHNIQNHNMPIYWLPPDLKCKKVMCASSARALTYDDLNDHFKRNLKESVNSFDLLGVRDHATFNLIKDIGLKDNSKLRMIPDPTFTYNINYDYSEKLLHKKGIDLTQPTIALNLPKSLKFAPQIADYFRNKKYQILTLNNAGYGDIKLIDISPFEWAGIFKKFQLVITDRFHGTLFSLKNLIPVLSIICRRNLITKNGYSKYSSLLEPFGLHETNLISALDLNNAKPLFQKADHVMENFDRGLVERGLEKLKTTYYHFVDDIAKLLS